MTLNELFKTTNLPKHYNEKVKRAELQQNQYNKPNIPLQKAAPPRHKIPHFLSDKTRFVPCLQWHICKGNGASRARLLCEKNNEM